MSQHQVVKLSEFASAVDRPFDIFICSASYEERCKSVPDAVAHHEGVGKRLVCFNHKSSPTVAENAKYLLDKLGNGAEKVLLDKTDPLSTADSLQRALSREKNSRLSYLIDITTFTHEALLILLRLIQVGTKRSSVVLAYAPAKEYSVGLPVEQKWLSRGITNIRSVLGYPGENRPSRKSHLIILAGFEVERAERLIDEYQPHVISLGLGKLGTATAVQHEQVNRMAFAKLAKRAYRYKDFEFSCVDVAQVEGVVAIQSSLFPDCNVVVAPMNSKLSTVGVAGAAFRNKDIQICYASASVYNVEGYSSPGDTCILTELSSEFWESAEVVNELADKSELADAS